MPIMSQNEMKPNVSYAFTNAKNKVYVVQVDSNGQLYALAKYKDMRKLFKPVKNVTLKNVAMRIATNEDFKLYYTD